MRKLDQILSAIGLVRKKAVFDIMKLYPSEWKHLDEHRELVMNIQNDTDLLLKKPWTRNHLHSQDLYIQRMCELRTVFHAEHAERQSLFSREFPYQAYGVQSKGTEDIVIDEKSRSTENIKI